VETKSRRKDVG